MKYALPCAIAFLTIIAGNFTYAQQSTYFPPIGGSTWETTDPDSLGWCEERIDALYSFLDESNSKAFIVLKEGKIVLEQYFDEFTADSVWYWASAGKVMVASLVGIAQEEGLLDINDPVSDYLGTDWTNCEEEDELQRTVFHQLSMSSGFNTAAVLWDCTEPECFNCQYTPGETFHYHNGVYRRLIEVVEEASGLTRNQYTTQKIKNAIGMGGFWFDQLYISNARSMARFGLLASNDFVWNGNTILGDTDYINAMRNTANPDNPAYGYLWWLNGKEYFLAPLNFDPQQGYLIPTAPADLYAGMGANDQRLYIVPSEGLVVVRLGEVAIEDSPAVSAFDTALWEKIMNLNCNPLTAEVVEPPKDQLLVFPNPSQDHINIGNPERYSHARVLNAKGQTIWEGQSQVLSDPIALPKGFYVVKAHSLSGKVHTAKAVLF